MKINIFKYWVAIAVCFVIFAQPIASVVAYADVPIRVSVNGEYISFPDVQPMIVNNRVLVPLRSLESISSQWTIEWNESTSTATIIYEAHPFKQIITIVPGSKSISIVNYDRDFDINKYVLRADNPNEQSSFDTAPQIINGRIMIPLRMLEDFIWGSIMEWDNSTKTVIITQVAG